MLLALIFAANAYALGPIPNGTYKGTETCAGLGSFPTQIVVTDTVLEWDGQKNSFTIDANGFFEMKTLNGMPGVAMGHMTSDGMHYEAKFDFRKKGEKKPKWAPGEDTFTYRDGKLTLEASASGEKGKVECSGVFSK